MIVDTHVHVVSPDTERYPLRPRPLSGEWYREAPHSAERLLELMDGAGVDRAVLVQPVGAYSTDNRYAADSAASHPGRFASVGCVDAASDDAPEALGYWVRERGMHGVRFFALSRGSSWLAEPSGFPLWERAIELGAHVVVTILSHQLDELRAALERFPDAAVSLDHCAFPTVSREPWPEAQPLFALAGLENLYLKITPHVLDAAARSGDPADFVTELARRFGAERLMWGSDFCQTHDRPYGELVALARRGFAGLTAGARASCLGETARRLFRLD